MKILLIEDNPGDARLIRAYLGESDAGEYDLSRAETLKEGLQVLSREDYDLVLTDLGLPDSQGVETFLEVQRATNGQVPIIVLSGQGDEATTTGALGQGAQDYLIKGEVETEQLVRSIRYSVERQRVQNELKKHREHLEELVVERTAALQESNEELKREIQAREESEERFRELFRHMSNGVAVYEVVDGGKDFVFKDLNEAGERITNVRKSDVVGRSVAEVFPGVKPMGLFEVLQRVWQTGKPEDHPVAHYSDEQLQMWVENYVYRLPSGEVVAVFDDVTEQREAETIIEELARFPRENPYPVFRVDPNGRLLFANPATRPLLRFWDMEEGDFIPEAYRQQVNTCLENGKRRMDEVVLDKTIYSLTYTPVQAGGYVNVYGLDISDLKETQARLKSQIDRLSLLNQITRAIAERQDVDSLLGVLLSYLEDRMPVDFGAVWRRDTDEDIFRFSACGPLSTRLIEKTCTLGPEELPLNDTLVEESVARGLLHVRDTSKQQEPLLQAMAERDCLSAALLPFTLEKKVLGLLMVCRRNADAFAQEDLDFLSQLSVQVSLALQQKMLLKDLEKAYHELKATQEATLQQERLRALGQMASGIVHDINNALSPIMGYSELMLAHADSLGERNVRYLKNIAMAAADISHIVSRMREFYRKREEQDRLLPLDLNQVAEQVVAMTRPRWRDIPQEQGIVVEMNTELASDLPTFAGNESEIREVVTNLVLNAVDALEEGGEVTIKTRRTPKYAILEVQDNGVGMDEETRRQCLDPFFSTKGDKGTGLGLAMAYGVMQRHEGDLEIDTSPGKGTTVRLVFPAHVTPDAGEKTDIEPVLPEPLRILYIDDEASLRSLLKEMLQSDGHVVDVADGGQAGIDAFHAARERGEPFDVVITDLGMPYVDGRDVISEVHRADPSAPVILLTGWGGRLQAEGDLPEGISDVLNKPPLLHDLRRALHRTQIKNI